MGKYEKLYKEILSGNSNHNIKFADLCKITEKLGYSETIRGDHHKFIHSDIDEILDYQPDGSKAKAYQVRQLRDAIIKNNLKLD